MNKNRFNYDRLTWKILRQVPWIIKRTNSIVKILLMGGEIIIITETWGYWDIHSVGVIHSDIILICWMFVLLLFYLKKVQFGFYGFADDCESAIGQARVKPPLSFNGRRESVEFWRVRECVETKTFFSTEIKPHVKLEECLEVKQLLKPTIFN